MVLRSRRSSSSASRRNKHAHNVQNALTNVDLVFREVDARRKDERYRRGVRPDAVTFIEHGPLRVLLSASPTADTLHAYVDTLRSYNVTHVVRVCEPFYDATVLEERYGVKHSDWPFADGMAPPHSVVHNWLDLLDDVFNLSRYSSCFPSSYSYSASSSSSTTILPGQFYSSPDYTTPTPSPPMSDTSSTTTPSPNSSSDGGLSIDANLTSSSTSASTTTTSASNPNHTNPHTNSTEKSPQPQPQLQSQAAKKPPTVAIHCAAGLGRAPVLVAVALVELGLSPHEAVGWIRAVRRGAINSHQLMYIQGYEKRPLPQAADMAGSDKDKKKKKKRSRSPFSFLSSWRRSFSPSRHSQQQQQQQQQQAQHDGTRGKNSSCPSSPCATAVNTTATSMTPSRLTYSTAATSSYQYQFYQPQYYRGSATSHSANYSGSSSYFNQYLPNYNHHSNGYSATSTATTTPTQSSAHYHHNHHHQYQQHYYRYGHGGQYHSASPSPSTMSTPTQPTTPTPMTLPPAPDLLSSPSSYQALTAMRKAQLAQGRYVSM